MRLLQVEAVTGYDANGRPMYTRLREDGLTPGVATSGSLRLTFDRFLLPARVIRQAICVRPTLEAVPDLGACREPFQTFTEPDYDPVRRTVTFRLSEGRRHLPSSAYRLTVFDAESEDDTGFRAIDGASLDRAYAFDFETQPEGGDERDEVEPGPDAYCTAVRCFRACDGDAACEADCRPLCLDDACFGGGDLIAPLEEGGPPEPFDGCGVIGCHRGGDGLEGAAMGLDLSSLDRLALALGRVAHQTQTGSQANEGLLNPQPFGRAMPLIDPSNPGNSYLLYKLVVDADNLVAAPDPAEVQRLRETVVRGLPMPAAPSGAGRGMVPGDPERSQARLDRLRAWIAAGAVLRCQ